MSNSSFSRYLQIFGLTETDDRWRPRVGRRSQLHSPPSSSSFVCRPPAPSFSQYFKITFVFSVSSDFPFVFSCILKCVIFLLHFKITVSAVVVPPSVAPGGSPWGNLCPCGCSGIWPYVRMFWNFIWGLWDPYWQVILPVTVYLHLLWLTTAWTVDGAAGPPTYTETELFSSALCLH